MLEAGEIDAAIADVRKATQSDDLGAIRKATEELQRLSHAMAEQLYKAQAAAGAGASHAGGAAPKSNETDDIKDGEVVDA